MPGQGTVGQFVGENLLVRFFNKRARGLCVRWDRPIGESVFDYFAKWRVCLVDVLACLHEILVTTANLQVSNRLSAPESIFSLADESVSGRHRAGIYKVQGAVSVFCRSHFEVSR